MQSQLYFDLETTDLIDGRAIEVAYAIHTPGEVGPGEVITFRVKPHSPIDLEAMEVHHITELDVINQPHFKDHPEHGKLSDFVKNMVLIAHNAPFDIGVLNREGIETGTYIDTKRVAMHLYPNAKNHRLQYLRHYLGCNVFGVPHSAEGDVLVLIAVFQKMALYLIRENGYANYQEVIEKCIELTKSPALLSRVPGRLKKHAGENFSEVNRVDRPYIEWAAKQDWEELDIKEDLKFTLNHWLRIRSV